jgi:predicted transposase YdaD
MCREEGREEGRDEGLQEGALIRARESVIEALEIRFGEVPFSLRERIIGLDDLSALKTELRRAITVPNLDQF